MPKTNSAQADYIPHTDKRKTISDKLHHLLQPRDALRQQLLAAGADAVALQRWCSGIRKNPTAAFDKNTTAANIDKLLSMGGIVSGGAALACATGKFATKDIDFYFKDDIQYVLASLATVDDPTIDVNLYIETPHELHDMAIAMCNMDASGIHMEPQCLEALNTGVSELYVQSIIYPGRTTSRMAKYHTRLGMKFKAPQVLAMCAIYQLPPNIWQSLSHITT